MYIYEILFICAHWKVINISTLAKSSRVNKLVSQVERFWVLVFGQMVV